MRNCPCFSVLSSRTVPRVCLFYSNNAQPLSRAKRLVLSLQARRETVVRGPSSGRRSDFPVSGEDRAGRTPSSARKLCAAYLPSESLPWYCFGNQCVAAGEVRLRWKSSASGSRVALVSFIIPLLRRCSSGHARRPPLSSFFSPDGSTAIPVGAYAHYVARETAVGQKFNDLLPCKAGRLSVRLVPARLGS